ncbi:uncharacterized protein LOC127004082 isoform X3 [Eriocheir sinensis]|uniref:uncharacterized protein LOC127004082 isoform X3 n=1 Tax=Eriocheir sinensis TaxID=95602 RepID=UPI0021CA8FAF|nr:uncharacterized protein LOC127004082 isoform X3 [Eriocheir sinensis]
MALMMMMMMTYAGGQTSRIEGSGGMVVGGHSGGGAGGSITTTAHQTVYPSHGPPAPTPTAASSSSSASSLGQSLSESLFSSLKSFYESMTNNFSEACRANCSGRGECLNGTCVCLVQYEGDTCREPNLAYFISFATVFYLIAAVSLAQLVVCVRAEYMRQKAPSLRRACRVTTQKMLYVITFVAATLRGAYFSSPANADLKLAPSFVSAFYPIILSGGSLIVCFWAEAFHLRDIRCDRPRFLSKSFCGFLTFNVLTYSLLVAEIVLTRQTITLEERSFFTHIFNGCYAVLLFIVVVFFLIYGVEVYFKLQVTGKVRGESTPQQGIDQSQLHQSRFGLVFQACMLMITVCFLFSDVLGGFWKNRVPLMSRNAYDIIFRVVELGVALWFPCVLWNCMSPEQLWILNPKKILKKLDMDRSLELGQTVQQKSEGVSGDGNAECWICYDTERTDAGQMIQPCDCRGDVGAVHHNCLRKWLMECAENSSENLSCKVCGAVYQLERGRAWWIGQGFTTRHWLQTASLVTVMCGTIAGAWTLIQMYEDAYIRSLAAGATLLIIYVCLKFLGFNTFSAYQRARYSAVKILGRHFAQREPCSGPIEAAAAAAAASPPPPPPPTNVATISSEVLVDMNATGLPKMPEATI